MDKILFEVGDLIEDKSIPNWRYLVLDSNASMESPYYREDRGYLLLNLEDGQIERYYHKFIHFQCIKVA